MKKILYTFIFAFIFFIPHLTHASFIEDYDYGWTWVLNGEDYSDAAYGSQMTAVDSQDNVYVTGEFTGTVNFNPDGSDERTSAGNSDIFITKFSSDGTYAWTKTMGGILKDRGNSLTIDSEDNVYVSGYFNGIVNFNPDGSDERTSTGSDDIFITKFSSDGTYSWTKTMGGTLSDRLFAVTTDSENNIYVAGEFHGTANFNPDGSDERTSAGNCDIFITKFSSDGTYSWTKAIGGAGWDRVYSITTDSDDNVYFTGEFRETVNFNPDGTDERTVAGIRDIFITKFSSGGTYAWTKTMGGTQDEYGNSVTTDSEDNVYVTGGFSGTVNFNPDGSDERTAPGNSDIYITKFSSDGTYSWTKTMSGAGGVWATSIITDSEDNLYTAGAIYGTIDFNPDGDEDEHTPVGWGDVYITKFSSNGTYEGTFFIEAATPDSGVDGGVTAALDSMDNLYISGIFYESADFDPTEGEDIRTESGSGSAYLTKLSRIILTPEPEPEPEEPEIEPEAEPARSSGGGVRYGCKDESALNYDYFTRHKQELCEYPSQVDIQQTLFDLIKEYREVFIQAQKNGAALPQEVLELLGSSSDSGLNSMENSTVRNLGYGMEGSDVRSLQIILINEGYKIPAGPTDYFGQQTQSALIEYQKANNIVPAVGYFGPITRAQMKSAEINGVWW